MNRSNELFVLWQAIFLQTRDEKILLVCYGSIGQAALSVSLCVCKGFMFFSLHFLLAWF